MRLLTIRSSLEEITKDLQLENITESVWWYCYIMCTNLWLSQTIYWRTGRGWRWSKSRSICDCWGGIEWNNEYTQYYSGEMRSERYATRLLPLRTIKIMPHLYGKLTDNLQLNMIYCCLRVFSSGLSYEMSIIHYKYIFSIKCL